MRFQASRNSNGFNGDYQQSESHPASYRHRCRWQAVDRHGRHVDLRSRQPVCRLAVADGGGYGSAAADTAKITTVVDGDRTYVLAELPRAIAASAQLQVTRTGLDPVTGAVHRHRAGLDRTFAAFAFSEPTDYTAQIIGPTEPCWRPGRRHEGRAGTGDRRDPRGRRRHVPRSPGRACHETATIVGSRWFGPAVAVVLLGSSRIRRGELVHRIEAVGNRRRPA